MSSGVAFKHRMFKQSTKLHSHLSGTPHSECIIELTCIYTHWTNLFVWYITLHVILPLIMFRQNQFHHSRYVYLDLTIDFVFYSCFSSGYHRIRKSAAHIRTLAISFFRSHQPTISYTKHVPRDRQIAWAEHCKSSTKTRISRQSQRKWETVCIEWINISSTISSTIHMAVLRLHWSDSAGWRRIPQTFLHPPGSLHAACGCGCALHNRCNAILNSLAAAVLRSEICHFVVVVGCCLGGKLLHRFALKLCIARRYQCSRRVALLESGDMPNSLCECLNWARITCRLMCVCVCVLATFEIRPRTKSNDAHSCVCVKYLHYACVLCNISGENCHFYYFLAKIVSYWLFLPQKVCDFSLSLSPLTSFLFLPAACGRKTRFSRNIHFVKLPRQISLCLCHTCLCSSTRVHLILRSLFAASQPEAICCSYVCD